MTNSAWSVQEIEQLYDLPLHELILQAGQVHAKNFPDGDIELATLLSIKTGGCPEDCSYCPQAARYHTGSVGNWQLGRHAQRQHESRRVHRQPVL